MKPLYRVLSILLSLVILASAAAVTSFAAPDYAYYYSDEQHTSVVIEKFTGQVPEDGVVEIPATIETLPVSRIADGAFAGNQTLKTVILPSAAVIVDADAFTGCANEIRLLVAADAPSGGNYADDVSDFVMNGSVLTAYNGSEAAVALPYGCTAIAPEAFKGNISIRTLILTTDVKSIGASAFENCVNLSSITLDTRRQIYTPDVGADAFRNTALLNSPSGDWFMIGSTLVKYTGAASGVTIPPYVVRLGPEAFVNERSGGIAARIKIPATVSMFDAGCFLTNDGSMKLIAALTVYAGSPAQKYLNGMTVPYALVYLPCDADADGNVTAADARLALRVSAQLDPVPATYPFTTICDTDGNGKLTAADARFILRVSAGLERAPEQDITSESPIIEPSGEYDTLLLLAQVIDNARASAKSYNLYEYQEFTDFNMNMSTFAYLSWFNDQLTHQEDAQVTSYTMQSPDGLAKLPQMKLRDTTIIKSCTLSENPDGTGLIRIELLDEMLDMRDTYKNPLTAQMFPVEPVGTYTDRIRKRWWFNDSGTNLHFTMTYTGCVLEASFEPATRRLTAMNMDMYYFFDIDPGTIQNMPILDKSFGNDGADATRHDRLEYSVFRY